MTVAVIDASVHGEKLGNKADAGLAQPGVPRVIPVNPTATIVGGKPASASVLDYDGAIDEVIPSRRPPPGSRTRAVTGK